MTDAQWPARPFRIGVIGSSAPEPGRLDAARAVGAALARAGALVVCGGLGGVMRAAAEGAAGEGGTVLGFLPGEDDRSAAAAVTIPIPTGMGDTRNTLVARASEAVIAVAGGWGTLNEAAMCMVLGIPLVGLDDELGERFPIDRFEDPAAAVGRALDLAGARRAAPASPAPGGDPADTAPRSHPTDPARRGGPPGAARS